MSNRLTRVESTKRQFSANVPSVPHLHICLTVAIEAESTFEGGVEGH